MFSQRPECQPHVEQIANEERGHEREYYLLLEGGAVTKVFPRCRKHEEVDTAKQGADMSQL